MHMTVSTFWRVNFIIRSHVYLHKKCACLASPRLRLLDPATTMRYKHVCWDYIPIYRWGKYKKIIKISIAIPGFPSYSVVSRSHWGDADWCDPPLSPLDCPPVPVVCSLVAESPSPDPTTTTPPDAGRAAP